MRIAVDVSPISESSSSASAHKVRGVGAYINMLITNLPKYDKKNEYFFVENKIFSSDIDLIHFPYFDPFFITLPGKLPTKSIVTVHDLMPLVFPEHFPAGIRGRIKWLIQKSRLKKADLIITDSDCSRRDVVDIVKIPENKARTVHLAANPKFVRLKAEDLRDARRKFSLPESFLLYVGDATWNKNLPRLIEAVKKTKFKLVMVGKVWETAEKISSNPWDDDLRKVFKVIENDSQFIRLGFVSDEGLVALYNMATAAVMPSIYEGFGLPILEAMSCGCPVITTREGSLPEVAGDAVLYVDYKSEESIKGGIERVFSETQFRKELLNKGLIQAKKFSMEKMMKNLVHAYEEIYR